MTFQSLTLTLLLWKKISDSNLVPASEKDFGNLLSGTKNFINKTASKYRELATSNYSCILLNLHDLPLAVPYEHMAIPKKWLQSVP